MDGGREGRREGGEREREGGERERESGDLKVAGLNQRIVRLRVGPLLQLDKGDVANSWSPWRGGHTIKTNCI